MSKFTSYPPVPATLDLVQSEKNSASPSGSAVKVKIELYPVQAEPIHFLKSSPYRVQSGISVSAQSMSLGFSEDSLNTETKKLRACHPLA